jgi:hypothetical protein
MRLFVTSVSAFVLVAALVSSAALAGDIPTGSGAPAAQKRLSKKKGAGEARATSIAEAWRLLPQMQGQRCGEDLSYNYEDEGGMRNFFCRALSVISWKTFLSLAPVKPFRSGPHKNGKLDLRNPKDFGRYDPAFVKWAATALVPAAEDAQLREQTQPAYDRSVRTLARTYYRVWLALSQTPSWVEAEKKLYLEAAARGSLDAMDSVLEPYHEVLGTADEEWGGHDPNHVRSATMWWLRRFHDGTASTWAEGLERLLLAYDAEWLGAEKLEKRKPLPVRPAKVTPEYR